MAEAPALPEAAAGFLRELGQIRRAAPLTLRAYERDLRALVRLHGPQFETVTTADVRRYAARLHAGGLAPSSLARTLSGWRSFYRWLAACGGLSVNPVVGVRAPRRPKRLPKALPVDQAVSLAGHAADPEDALALRDKALVELL